MAVDRLSLEIPDRSITVLVGTVRLWQDDDPADDQPNGRAPPRAPFRRRADLQQQPVTTLCRSMGYVIQNAGLFQHRTIIDNIATVPRMIGWGK
ncbi:hypothetical protein LV779_10530 [Streptomyces thinghirensis]|nr:hypothetical protein [Streptomyces thinghirensis]